MNAFHHHACVLAVGPNGELGYQNDLPWPRIPADMALFRIKTTGTGTNAVVMGRKTWCSIPAKHRPLPKRLNIVVTRNREAREEYDIPESVKIVHSFDEIERVEGMDSVAKCFIVGGASLYETSIKSGLCRRVFITRIGVKPAIRPEVEEGAMPEAVAPLDADVFFPLSLLSQGTLTASRTGKAVEKDGVLYTPVFETYLFPAPAFDTFVDTAIKCARDGPTGGGGEGEYLNLVARIMRDGVGREDRTGVGTISLFGPQMRFNLRNGVLPLLTTKKTFWRGLAVELLWFISGSTNARVLSEQGIKIWDANGSRDFLDSRGLVDREEGDLGPVYGFQWRHFGATYVDMHHDYTGKGVDQLKEVIRQIRENPTSRRIVMSAWNPADLDAMALPPCHMFAQFYVSKGELSCQLYQRSADMGLGVPFNIASYALLTHLIAKCTGLKAGELVHTIGDAHVYLNHVDALREQLTRRPFPFPTLTMEGDEDDVDAIRYEDLVLKGYRCHPPIKMAMAV